MRNYVAGLCLLAVPMLSIGEPEVVIDSGSGTLTNVQKNLISGSWEISFTAVGTDAVTVAVQVPQGASDSIRWVRVEANDPLGNGTRVEVTVRAKPGTNGQLERVEEVSFTSNDGTFDGELWIWVETNGTSGNADGNIGTAGTTPGGLIEGHVIRNLIAGASGNLTAEVTTLARLDGGIDANIDGITVAGDILNDISTTNGKIKKIIVQGDIGASGSLIAITTTGHLGKPNPTAILSIESISASAIYADITTPHTSNETDRGDMGPITTTSGDFKGSLTTFAMQGGSATNMVDIAGHLYADIQTWTIKKPTLIHGDVKSGATITMTNSSKALGGITIEGELAGLIDFKGEGTTPSYDADITIDSIASTGQILVAEDMKGDITCTGTMAGFINIDMGLIGDITIVASSGLVGQIIINSADGGDSWTGTVIVNSTTLSPDGTYTQTGLGGGAVGEVGFDCHLQDCIPPYVNSTSPTLTGEFEVTLRHYGPVIWLIDGSPVKVMFCSENPTCIGDSDVSDDFEVTSTPNGLRHVVLVPKSGITPSVGTYHISPTADLFCDDTTATRPGVASYTYDVRYNG